MQTIRLFYKVENDIDGVAVKSDSQKYGFRKLNDNELELPEEEDDDEDDEEDEEEAPDDEDDEGMTLEMRVEQLKQFSNYFSDEE
jgi:hypothetical protein